ncbi:MAG: rod shape-determining protein MreC [Gammaproteobacteria bacterium]|nr:rod shape-determining protein MreC [Gammaproteobacteria bacterium]
MFFLNPSSSVKLILLAMLSVGMMITDYHYNRLGILRSSISVVLSPIEYLAWLPSKMYISGTKVLATQKKLLTENARLHANQALIELQLQKLAILEHENTRLRKLLTSTKPLKKEQVLIAELISIDLDPYRQRIVLNKGTMDGVYEGQPLLGAKGIIGQVDKASPFRSIAILISDPNHALLGVIARNGHRSLVVGTGNAEILELQHIVSTTDIRIGDLITTSGLDGRYPPNYPVAKVTSIRDTTGEAFVKVEAKPLIDLNAIQEILLIRADDESLSRAAENITKHP